MSPRTLVGMIREFLIESELVSTQQKWAQGEFRGDKTDIQMKEKSKMKAKGKLTSFSSLTGTQKESL